MKYSTARLAVLLTMLAGPVAAQSQDPGLACSSGPQVDAIVDQRERFNAAMRLKDIETIDGILTDDVVLVTGTDSDVYTGRVRQLALWARNFQADDRLIYARTPTCIDVSARFPIALEHGRWRGEPEAEGVHSFAEGRYSAKWRIEDGAWRLEVETYMTETCGGAICPEPQDPEDEPQ